MSTRGERFRWAAAMAFVITCALGATGCVESAVFEKTAAERDQARRDVARKEQQIDRLEAQIAQLRHLAGEAQQRDAATRRALETLAQKLATLDAALAASLAAASSGGALACDSPGHGADGDRPAVREPPMEARDVIDPWSSTSSLGSVGPVHAPAPAPAGHHARERDVVTF